MLMNSMHCSHVFLLYSDLTPFEELQKLQYLTVHVMEFWVHLTFIIPGQCLWTGELHIVCRHHELLLQYQVQLFFLELPKYHEG